MNVNEPSANCMALDERRADFFRFYTKLGQQRPCSPWRDHMEDSKSFKGLGAVGPQGLVSGMGHGQCRACPGPAWQWALCLDPSEAESLHN